MSFRFISFIPKYLNVVTFSNDSLAVPIFWLCPDPYNTSVWKQKMLRKFFGSEKSEVNEAI
jgi:hypothetical protein